jgi:hypothetical protein
MIASPSWIERGLNEAQLWTVESKVRRYFRAQRIRCAVLGRTAGSGSTTNLTIYPSGTTNHARGIPSRNKMPYTPKNRLQPLYRSICTPVLHIPQVIIPTTRIPAR